MFRFMLGVCLCGLGLGLSFVRNLVSKTRMQHANHRRRTQRLGGIEGLEGRALLATFTVTNVSDSGAGSFREAVLQANATAGADSIAFAIPGAGAKTISPLSALPAITDSVVIDGTTQGSSATPLIEIDGGSAGATASGIRLTGGNSTLRGLAITNFQLNAVLLASNGNRIEGSFIGLGTNGSTPAPNLLDGVLITGSNNVIGGSTTATANVISGNGRNGIAISGLTASNNIVEGNTIGLDLFKTTKTPNVQSGVKISGGAQSNTVGGLTAAQRNLISGNTAFGVLIEGAGTNSNTVQGNFIGTSSSNNGGNGVGIAIRGGAKFNTVGSTDINGRNTISGNVGSGVQLRGVGTTDNQVIGNRIGLLDSGLIKLANGEDGILIDTGAANNTIGGPTSAHGNVISGNTKSGVNISGAGTTGNDVLSNLIGLNILGSGAVGNLQGGITVRSGATNTDIGAGGAGNTISGNSIAGVRLFSTSGNKIAGNAIGTNSARIAAVPNALDGVVIDEASTNNTIGGSNGGDANVISGNTRAGVRISGLGTTNNLVIANQIGTAADTNLALGNAIGVWVTSGAKSNSIGTAGLGNTISGNFTFGVLLIGGGTQNNLVRGNHIGTNAAGTAAVGNFDGVNISAGAKNNTIGGSTVNDRNTISGNSRDGVSLTGATTSGNSIRGNLIGISATSNGNLNNLRHGVSARGGANGNFIGSSASTVNRNFISRNNGSGIFLSDPGTTAIIVNNIIGLTLVNNPGANFKSGIEVVNGATATIGGFNSNQGNVISGNVGPGILITGSNTSGVSIHGNLIGLDPTGLIPRGNQNDGIRVEGAKNTTIGNAGPVRNVIASNSTDGIHLLNASNATIKGTLIGTDPAGLVKRGNGNGVRIEQSTNILVGGATAADRNIISGSVFDGVILIDESGSDANPNVRVENNFIGLGSDGTTIIANKDGVQYASILGQVVFANNVVSGNTRFGIRTASTSNQVIIGNKIGVLADGTTPAGNGSHGIFLHTNSSDNRIGGDLASDSNIIAHNGGDGVLIGSDPTGSFPNEAGTGNSLIRNLIFANGGLAIDLGANNGTTANDLDDVDVGPNGLQNAPVITLATTVGDAILIRGSLDSLAGSYRIDFYAGASAGQAQQFLGSLLDEIDVLGILTMVLVLEANVEVGSFVTAVATNLDTGDSSELAVAVGVV